jgi:hypothetical protein
MPRGSGTSRADPGILVWPILTYLLPFVLFMAFCLFLMGRGQGKGRDGRRVESEASPNASTRIGKPTAGCYR